MSVVNSSQGLSCFYTLESCSRDREELENGNRMQTKARVKDCVEVQRVSLIVKNWVWTLLTKSQQLRKLIISNAPDPII